MMNLDTWLNHVPLAILNLFDVKLSIPMIIWIVLIDLKRQNYHHKMRSSTNYRVAHVQIPSTHKGIPHSSREAISDYHNVYLQLDVLLLADFFEKFHRNCLELYSLDPLHYYTTPSLAWDAALRMLRVDLQLITNENMYNFVENSIRGSIL